MQCMYRAMQELGLDTVRLVGFDSFEGLPPSAAFDDEGTWRPGQFDSSYDLTYRALDEAGVDWRRVMLVRGWFSDSLTEAFVREQGLKKASVIMIDCDMYLSAKQALTFCAPLIGERSIIFFDDWEAGRGSLSARRLGERRAFEEFLAENPALVAEEREDLQYRTADTTAKTYSRVFEVTRVH